MGFGTMDWAGNAARRGRAGRSPRRRARAGLVLAVLALLIAAPPGALAEPECTPARKVGRGLSNLTLGVLAIPGQMVVQSEERGPALGVPLGFATGIGWFVTTEVIGLWEFLTCPFPFPKGYRPIIEPEFPWQYFE